MKSKVVVSAAGLSRICGSGHIYIIDFLKSGYRSMTLP